MDAKQLIKFPKKFYNDHPIISNLVFILLVGWLLILFAFWFFDVFTHHGSTATVPNIRNMQYAEAAAAAADNDLLIEIADSVYDENMAGGIVKEVWPSEGAVVKPGATIYVTVTSSDPGLVTIAEPLTGVSKRQAMSYLSNCKIKNVRIVPVDNQFADLVVNAKYNGHEIGQGTKLPINAQVVLEVGTGIFDHVDNDEYGEGTNGIGLDIDSQNDENYFTPDEEFED